MEQGCFDLLMIGDASNGQSVRVSIEGDDDPYETTAKLVSETALVLLKTEALNAGIWTPIAALRDRLVSAILEHAGIRTRIETAIS